MKYLKVFEDFNIKSNIEKLEKTLEFLKGKGSVIISNIKPGEGIYYTIENTLKKIGVEFELFEIRNIQNEPVSKSLEFLSNEIDECAGKTIIINIDDLYHIGADSSNPFDNVNLKVDSILRNSINNGTNFILMCKNSDIISKPIKDRCILFDWK